MCGLVYYHTTRQKPVSKKIIRKFRAQKHRGTKGFGVYRPLTNQLAHNTREDKAMEHLKKLNDNILMFHHRNPSSPVANVRNACHPFSTKDYYKTNYVFMHNGWINNKIGVKATHDRLKIPYVSMQPDDKGFCDSEALMWDVVRFIEGESLTVEAAGAVAFICYAHKNGTQPKLYYYHNTGNPLKLDRSKNTMSLASEGSGVDVPINKLFCYDYTTGKTTSVDLEIKTYVSSTYSHSPRLPNRSSTHPKPPEATPPAKGNANASRNARLLPAPLPSAETNPNNPFTPGSYAANAHDTIHPPVQPPAVADEDSKSDDNDWDEQDELDHFLRTTSPTLDSVSDLADDGGNSKLLLELRLMGSTVSEQTIKKLTPAIVEVKNIYLAECNGVFEDAAYLMISDADLFETLGEDDCETLIMAAFRLLEDDPYYIDAQAVHPKYIEELVRKQPKIIKGFQHDSIITKGGSSDEALARAAQEAFGPEKNGGNDNE